MTNHKRSAELADEKAPRKTNNDAAGKYCVRHLIILKPRANTRNHEKYNGCEMTGKNYIHIAYKIVIRYFLWYDDPTLAF